MSENPIKRILLISGKRKSGKDFISEKLSQIIGSDNCIIVRISEPIKSHYAKQKDLNLSELMSNNVYKEKYRVEMIQWSDEIRSRDSGYFCKAACNNAPHKSIWIISDVRRKTDIEWFRNTYGTKIKTIRILSDIDMRKQRGWVFTKGVDDVASECNLDDYAEWDLEVSNNNLEECDNAILRILDLLK